MELDNLDIKILKKLQENSRLSYNEIAKHVHTSTPTVKSRVERLLKLGVIEAFTIKINHEKLQDANFLIALLEVKPEHVQEKITELSAIDEIEEIIETASTPALILKINAENPFTIKDKINPSHIEALHLLPAKQITQKQHIALKPARIKLTCDYCHKEITDLPASAKIDDEHYYFCCNTCKTAFLDKYNTLKKRI
jgi:DNA-binding Lrp family transcriptional regulator